MNDKPPLPKLDKTTFGLAPAYNTPEELTAYKKWCSTRLVFELSRAIVEAVKWWFATQALVESIRNILGYVS